jgi:hypothetical protein
MRRRRVKRDPPLTPAGPRQTLPRVTTDRRAEFTAAAGEYVRRALHVELDGSVESLAYVDHYLSTIGGVSDEVLRLVAAAIGCYFGEVVIGHLGGAWEVSEEDPAEWIVALEAAPLRFRPVAMAAEAIRKDDLEEYDAAISVPAALEEPLAEALAAVGPVEADYYYSLTGRLETLEHAASVIAELRRRSIAEREEKSGDEGAEKRGKKRP